jgi:hypothetical protein
MPFEYPFPRSFTANSIREHAPRESGVFGISNARQWLYIGEADDIQSALLDFLQEFEAALPLQQPTGFVFETCDRNRRPTRQDRLIQEYEPLCNRQPWLLR